MRRLLVGAVIDASGSMGDQQPTVIDGYNEYLQTLAKQPAEIRVSRTHFADQVDLEHGLLPLVAVPRLTPQSYKPDGSTALYDGLGLTISHLEREERAEDRVLVFLVTDGHENYSRYWDEVRLHAKVAEKQATGRWTFVLFGAMAVEDTAAELGFLPGNIKSFEMTEEGVQDLFEEMAQGTVKLLTDGQSASRTFFESE